MTLITKLTSKLQFSVENPVYYFLILLLFTFYSWQAKSPFPFLDNYLWDLKNLRDHILSESEIHKIPDVKISAFDTYLHKCS